MLGFTNVFYNMATQNIGRNVGQTIVFFPDHDHDSVRSIIMQQNIHKVNYSAVGKLKAIWNFNLKITFLWTQLKAQICGKREQKL